MSRTTFKQSFRYLVFYKPFDVLCQFTDSGSQRTTLKDYIDVPLVYPVGRLDRDSEGLLLLTNDGGLQHRLSHPKFAHPRTYWVQVERIPPTQALERLRTGVLIKNYRTRRAQARILPESPPLPPRDPPIRDRQSVPTCWLEMILTEGRNRQVRRMTAAVGFPTLRLVRVAIGTKKRTLSDAPAPILSLNSLKPGQWRDLTAAERRALHGLTGLR